MSVASPLVDSHAHLQDRLYNDDRAEVLARANAAGLKAIVCVGYDLASSRRAVDLALHNGFIYAAVGIHPNYAATASDADWAAVCQLALESRVVGVGETGLDNYRQFTPPSVQETWFQRHLDLAQDLDLPVVIHNRQADERLREMLASATPRATAARLRGVMHCFSSDRAMLEFCLESGLAISLAGTITFKNAGPLREVARHVPGDRLMIETDCPYLAPHPHRGQRNEPSYLEWTARQLAAARGEPIDVLAESTTRVAMTLFGLELSRPQEWPRS